MAVSKSLEFELAVKADPCNLCDNEVSSENLEEIQIPTPLSVTSPLKQTAPTIVSKLKCPLEGPPRICITKEGDVWLGGWRSRELVMVDIKGQVLRRRIIQNRPGALAVMDCGDVIISPRSHDSSTVSRLMRDGREQLVYNTSPSYSLGVSVTTEQKILICTRDGGVVKINSDGTDVTHIYEGSGDCSAVHALEMANGNIYISDWRKQAVVMINKDGKVMLTITHTTGGQQIGGPWGLMMDKFDNILCVDKAKSCVYIIDQNQQIRELVGQSKVLRRPRWLIMDNDNNLWITQYNRSVWVFSAESLQMGLS